MLTTPSERTANRFLSYFKEVQKIHLEIKGEPLREYRPLEPHRLQATFDEISGLKSSESEFLGDMLHMLVWAQCLPNANHRTTVLFLEGVLTMIGIRFPNYSADDDAEERLRVAVDGFSDASHRLLDKQSEFAYNPTQIKKRHRMLCHERIKSQLGNQSLVETIIGPQRFMALFS